jgi:PPK2 family polyphosphate:nucleotide phosphotransferase
MGLRYLRSVDTLIEPVSSPYLVPFDGVFALDRSPTKPPEKQDKQDKKENEKALAELGERLVKLQAKLYAHDHYAVLLVFQAMDAAGKDGTIKAVMSGVNPTGCQVYSFKAPTEHELDHDFLWRVQRCLPERGRIGVFNRSHYEEVLVVRVNPKFLESQHLPRRPATLEGLWQERYESIRDAEKHWARNGMVILKFWLNVSPDEQRKRLLDRIDDPKGNWKFEAGDLKARAQWSDYMTAYQAALSATSRPWAPWYAIPADNKAYMRRTVAEIIVGAFERLTLHYPEVSAEERLAMLELRKQLVAEGPDKE